MTVWKFWLLDPDTWFSNHDTDIEKDRIFPYAENRIREIPEKCTGYPALEQA